MAASLGQEEEVLQEVLGIWAGIASLQLQNSR